MESLRFYLGCLAVVGFAAGCASSTVAQRKTERRAAYERLPAEVRAEVDRGEIAEGMDTNAVYVAWGKPTRMKSATTPEGAEVRWEYWRKWTRVHPYWSYEPGPGGYYFTAEYRPTTSAWKYESAWVVFRNDRVIRWGRLPPPTY
jgi:hypothetical protein